MELGKFQRLPFALLMAMQLALEDEAAKHGLEKPFVIPNNFAQQKAWERLVVQGFARANPIVSIRSFGYRVTLEGLRAYLRALDREPIESADRVD